MSFGDSLLQRNDPNFDSHITLFPFFSWEHELALEGALYHTDVQSYPFTVVDRFISKTTGEMFNPTLILVGMWRGDLVGTLCVYGFINFKLGIRVSNYHCQ